MTSKPKDSKKEKNENEVILLTDLVPTEDVTGGASKLVFGQGTDISDPTGDTTKSAEDTKEEVTFHE